MNWVLLVVILLVAGNIVWGYSRGFLRVAYSLVEWILIFVVISRGTPYVMNFLNENTSIPKQLTMHCEKQLQESFAEWMEPNAEENAALEGSDLSSVGIKLPGVLIDTLMEKNRGIHEAGGGSGAAGSRRLGVSSGNCPDAFVFLSDWKSPKNR